MLHVNFNAYNSYVTDSLYQWDINQVLNIIGLPVDSAPEVHFNNSNMDRAIVRQAELVNGNIVVNIPNSLLQSNLTIKAYIGIYENTTFKVIETVEIPVIGRARPYDYVFEDTDGEIYSFKALEAKINEAIIFNGDMKKEVYDQDNDGVVDVAGNGLFVYKHTAGELVGSGVNGKFKATATETVSSLNVNGLVCSVKCGEDTEIDLVTGAWYTFILDGATINFKQGGAGLNFKIVGGTTKPVSPKNNTIWVNTNVEIGEYQLSATEPETRVDGTALQNGDLWIKTGIDTNVEFNAVKKNAIKLKLVNSYQWNGSAWIAKTAKIYINSKWTDLSFVMYEKGVFAVTYSQSGNLGGITIGTDSIRFYNTGYPADNNYQYINLGGEIDWSQYSTVKVTLKSYTYSGSKPCYIAIGSSKTARDLASKSMGNSSVQTLDVSNVKTKGYLNIGIQVGVQSSGTTDVYVERVEIY